MALKYVTAASYPIATPTSSWDVVYINATVEDELRGHQASAAPIAVSLVALEPSCSSSASTALSAQGHVFWTQPAPPEWEDEAGVPNQAPAVFVPRSEEGAMRVTMRVVQPVPLTAAYIAVPPNKYEMCTKDATFQASLDGRILHTKNTCMYGDTPCRVLMTEPVAQGVVDMARTRIFLLQDEESYPVNITSSSTEPPAPSMPLPDAPSMHRFLARDTPPPTLAARYVPTRSMVSACIEAWKRRGNDMYVDEESVILVQERTLADLGLFDGEWAVASVLTENRPRVVRVFVTSHENLKADEAYAPPMLIANLFRTTAYDPLGAVALTLDPLPPHVTDELLSVDDERLRGDAAQPPLIPRAESVTLAQVASPFTTDRAYEEQCADALRAFLASHPRIWQPNDLFAVALVGGQARFQQVDVERSNLSDSHQHWAAHAQLPGWPPAYNRHAVFFHVAELTPSLMDPDTLQSLIPSTLPALRQWYMTLASSGSMAGAGCWVDAAHTRIVQQGTVQRRVADVHAWLGLTSDSPVCPPDGTPLTQPGSAFARLASLVHAALSPAAQQLDVHLLVLLEGAAGIGKRALTRWVAQRTGTHILELSCTMLVGDTDTHTDGAFQARCERARACGPCILLLRDIDVLIRKSAGEAAQGAMIKVLQRCLTPPSDTAEAMPLLVVATTEDGERCPAALRGLFNETIKLDPPIEPERAQWLQIAAAPYELGADVDLHAMAVQTAALLASDLMDVLERARLASVRRVLSAGSFSVGDVVAAKPIIVAADLDQALTHVRASYSESIGAPKIPNVTWDDVGGLASVKHEILDTVQLPLEHPELFSDGVKKRSGVLLYGPPGTGKTLLAKAVATTCALNFFSVKGPELLNMYIGESEANVRRVFQKARDAKPCVIFFDELDSIAPKRGNQGDSGGVMDRIVSQLLAELDGMASGSAASDVFVIGATNRPDLLDPALLRPGRFDRLLYLSVAETHDAQLNILQALTRKFTLDPDVGDLRVIAEQCPFNLTGADFYALCSDAMLKAMTHKASEIDKKVEQLNRMSRTEEQQHWPTPLTPQFYLSEIATPDEVQVKVARQHFEQALAELTPSVSPQEMEHYRQVQQKFSQPEKEEVPSASEQPAALMGSSLSTDMPMSTAASHEALSASALDTDASEAPQTESEQPDTNASSSTKKGKGKNKGKGKDKGKGKAME